MTVTYPEGITISDAAHTALQALDMHAQGGELSEEAKPVAEAIAAAEEARAEAAAAAAAEAEGEAPAPAKKSAK